MIAPLAAVVLAATMTVAPVAEVKPCKDPVIAAIRDAGWKGNDQAVAYAVAWRESNLRADAVGAGSYGAWQLQASAWSSRPFWDWDAVLTLKGGARIAHAVWKITGWSAWGITRDGRGIDSTYYGSWSSSTQWAWIWQPYAVGLKKYQRLPKGCRHEP